MRETLLWFALGLLVVLVGWWLSDLLTRNPDELSAEKRPLEKDAKQYQDKEKALAMFRIMAPDPGARRSGDVSLIEEADQKAQ